MPQSSFSGWPISGFDAGSGGAAPELSPGFLLDRHLGIRVHRVGLAAGKIHGDSMIYWDVLDGDIAMVQRYDFNYLQNGAIVMIEKRGEEEGFGAWL